MPGIGDCAEIAINERGCYGAGPDGTFTCALRLDGPRNP